MPQRHLHSSRPQKIDEVGRELEGLPSYFLLLTYDILLQTIPCAIIALATFMKPAMLAPLT